MVIDASVWVAAFLPYEPNHKAAQRCIAELSTSSEPTELPTLALVETCGAIARRTNSADAAQQIRQFLVSQHWISFFAVDSGLVSVASDIAINHKLRGADAIYVALAKMRSQPLISLDAEIIQRSKSIVECQVLGRD
ncbi:MAG TPA: PIN domain-containing protein [Candidatus Acidoferrum sp.]|nr:PIN domain-containing protein [Candidatus Acidoferrum sp.]